MFAKFKLNDIDYDFFYKYESIGEEYYDKIGKTLEKTLKLFTEQDGVIDGTKLQQEWFPIKQKFDVFLSHSHTDEKLAISLAGFLKEELSLDTFIDSCLWGYSNDLLREIDEKYCMNNDGKSFNYEKRNYSTSHVHNMLSIALSRMIDHCEAIFFLNSNNSISLSKEIEEITNSPWIYNELSLADITRIKSINEYRKSESEQESMGSLFEESVELGIKYNVNRILNDFIDLSGLDLINCSKEWKSENNKYQSALDYIYHSKKILPIKNK